MRRERFPSFFQAFLRAAGLHLLVFPPLMAAVVKAAWLCDDAFITRRTADDLLHGGGWTWNPGERVQVFTHPCGWAC